MTLNNASITMYMSRGDTPPTVSPKVGLMELSALSPIELIALQKSVNQAVKNANARELIEAGIHEVAPFAVECGGIVRVAEDGDRAGTARGTTAVSLALALHYAGVTGDAAEKAIVKSLTDLGQLTVADQKKFIRKIADERGDEAAIGMLKTVEKTLKALRDNLPRIDTKGAVKVSTVLRPAAPATEPLFEVDDDGKGVEPAMDEVYEAVMLINA